MKIRLHFKFLVVIILMFCLRSFSQTAPTAESPMYFCEGNITIEDVALQVVGENLIFWDAPTDGNQLDLSLILVDSNITIYASQGEFGDMLAIVIIISEYPFINITTVPTCSDDLLSYSFEFESSPESIITVDNGASLSNVSSNLWLVEDVLVNTDITISSILSFCASTYTVTSPNCTNECLPTSNITHTIPGTNLIEISWTENNDPPATVWEIAIVDEGSPIDDWIYTVTENPHITDGVIAGQNYDIYIRSICDVDTNVYSEWTVYEIRENTTLLNETYCAGNPNNSSDIDLSFKDIEVLNGDSASDFTISYYLNLIDAEASVNALQNIHSFWETQTVYVRKENNSDSTFEIFSYTITINEFVYAIQPTSLINCEVNSSFDLASKNQEISNNQLNTIVRYYLTQTDAENAVNSYSSFYTTTVPVLLYVRVTNIITSCYDITTLQLDFEECEETYTVNPLPFQIYSQPLNETFNLDDGYTQAIDLGFNFNYFGNEYSQVSVGTNSVISFDSADIGGFCQWQINEENQLPSSNIIDNAILGVYQDYDNVGGSQVYGFIGSAPFRKFVVFFDDVALFTCNSITSANQMILYETYNFIDVQIKDRNVCTTWNNGNAILGIQNIGGTEAYFPPNRNTGDWEAHDEGWRFKPQQDHPEFQYIVCDDNLDGVEVFEKDIIIDYFNEGNGNVYSFYYTLIDAENDVNSIFGDNFVNTSNAQTIFVREIDNGTGEITIHNILLAAIDCTADYDLDNVPTADEDLNGNGNFGDDDTDGDAIPDFIDEDDDGDYVLTNVEAVQTRNPEDGYLDTDNDQIPNYLDNDDDGDNILSLDEDANGNYNLLDDDTDGDNIPNYLDNNSLSVNSDLLSSFQVYPNPVKDILTIKLINNQVNTEYSIYSLQGSLVHNKQTLNTVKTEINISNLSSGVYFIKLKNDKQTAIRKFIKK